MPRHRTLRLLLAAAVLVAPAAALHVSTAPHGPEPEMGPADVRATRVGASGAPEVSDASGPLRWHGRDYVASVVPDPAACTPLTCDIVAFDLALPPGFWEGREGGLEVGVRWADDANDFDLFLYDGAGALVASSAGPLSDTEDLLLRDAAAGSYTAVVVPRGVAHTGYEGVVELEVHAARSGALLPNLATLPPYDLRVVAPALYGGGMPLDVGGQRPLSCTPDETLERRVTRCLRFSTAVANLGAGPLEARFDVGSAPAGMTDPSQRIVLQRVYAADGSHEDRAAGTYEFHAVHAHFHFNGFAQHELYALDPDGPHRVRVGEKVSFCMIDAQLVWWAQQGNGPRTYQHLGCDAPPGGANAITSAPGQAWLVEGISAGWADVYGWDLADQSIDIAGLADGCYDLESIADPGHAFRETTRADNRAGVTFRLHGDAVQIEDCAPGAPRP